MAEIARDAGVARGLLHHYFGTKRELFLEVVRSLVEPPPGLFADDDAGAGSRETALAAAVDRWLTVVERNRGTWLASVGAQGFGRDAELEAVLDVARERTADRVIALLGRDPSSASPQLRALVRAYASFAEAASLEWIERKRLSREQTAELLLRSLLALADDVLPEIEAGEVASRARARAHEKDERRAA